MRLILHIGAHRTGSTLIEQMLSSTAETADEGLVVWSPRHMRELDGFSRAHAHVDPRGRPLSIQSVSALASIKSDLALRIATTEARTLLISEENMLGTMGTNFRTGRFYPSVRARLAAFAAILPVPARVGLGIRGYGAVWNSAYGYVARRGKPLPSPAQARQALMHRARGWGAVVDAIQGVWPETELMIWRQEDLASNASSIAASLVDLDVGLVAPRKARVNASADKGQVIDLFSREDHDKLAARYRRHVRRLTDPAAGVRWAHHPEAA